MRRQAMEAVALKVLEMVVLRKKVHTRNSRSEMASSEGSG
jgi:hypothetical protein